jgi:hypothetical protein
MFFFRQVYISALGCQGSVSCEGNISRTVELKHVPKVDPYRVRLLRLLYLWKLNMMAWTYPI